MQGLMARSSMAADEWTTHEFFLERCITDDISGGNCCHRSAGPASDSSRCRIGLGRYNLDIDRMNRGFAGSYHHGPAGEPLSGMSHNRCRIRDQPHRSRSQVASRRFAGCVLQPQACSDSCRRLYLPKAEDYFGLGQRLIAPRARGKFSLPIY
jgi:hypothetical protein